MIIRIRLIRIVAVAAVAVPCLFGAEWAAAQSAWDNIVKKGGDVINKGTEAVRNATGDSASTGEQTVPHALAPPPDDRATVRTYSREQKYALQAALGGALVATAGNCALNVSKDKKCLDNAGVAAAVGGALGAAGGWIVASRQREYINAADAREKQLNSARLELEQARATREAAEKLVATREESLKSLSQEASTKKSAKSKLEEERQEAEADRASLEACIKRLEEEGSALTGLIASEKNAAAKSELGQLHAQLGTERELLQKHMERLVGAMTAAHG